MNLFYVMLFLIGVIVGACIVVACIVSPMISYDSKEKQAYENKISNQEIVLENQEREIKNMESTRKVEDSYINTLEEELRNRELECNSLRRNALNRSKEKSKNGFKAKVVEEKYVQSYDILNILNNAVGLGYAFDVETLQRPNYSSPASYTEQYLVTLYRWEADLDDESENVC